MEAAVAALADGEVAARDEHNCARRRHAHDADALLCGACLLCVRWRNYYGLADNSTAGAAGGRESVRRVPPELFSARHEVRVAVDVLLGFPLLVGPETFEQLLCVWEIVSCKIKFNN